MAIWSHSISRDNAIPRNGISPPFRTSHTHAQLINRPFAHFPHFPDNSRFEVASSVAFRIFTRNFALLSLSVSLLLVLAIAISYVDRYIGFGGHSKFLFPSYQLDYVRSRKVRLATLSMFLRVLPLRGSGSVLECVAIYS